MKGPTEIKKKTVLALGIIYILNVTFFHVLAQGVIEVLVAFISISTVNF